MYMYRHVRMCARADCFILIVAGKYLADTQDTKNFQTKVIKYQGE